MASVTDLTTTGDNDPEIFPVQYENHYMYCDNCGSFELKLDFTPANHADLAARRDAANRIARYALIASLIVFIPSLLVFGIPLILTFAVFLLAKIAAMRFDSRIKAVGLICEQCRTKYAFGSSFFNNVEGNPRGYSMSDVPRPLYTVYQIRGSTIGPAEEA